MKQGNAGPASPRPNVRRVSATRAGSEYVVGELNIGGQPCDVIYRGPESSAGVRPAPFSVNADGAVNRERAGGRGPVNEQAATAAEPRVLARRDESRLAAIQLPPDMPPDAGAQGGDLQKLHQLLRGRYIIAILLALLLGGAGIWAGLRFGYKTYQSTGLITITPIHLFPSQDNSQSIEQFMLAQAAKFKSQRVMDAALDDPEWHARQVTRSDAFEAAFAKELEVTQQGQMLRVTFTDRDPAAAAIAVQTTMQAFKKIFESEQRASGVLTQDQWNQARNDLNYKLTAIQAQIDEKADIYGAEGVEVRRDIKLQELREVESGITSLDMIQVQLAAAPEPKAVGPTTEPATNVPVDEIARVDTLIANLLNRRTLLKQEIAELSAGGALGKLPKLERTKALLASVEDEIGKRADDWRATHLKASGAPVVATANGSTQTLTPAELKAKSDYLHQRQKSLQDELKKLSDQIGAISKLRIQKDRIQKDLNTAEEELQQDEIEKTKWRVDVSDADRPLGSFRDTRITFAGAGGLGGMIGGFGLVLLMGLMDRRVRDSRDAAGQFPSGPVLGILPQLPEDLADPEQAASAAHCVHEVRTLLQIWGRGQNHQVFGVTSSAAGSGKTSLTLALGVSFATAKFKTLLIDCDLVGGGLSSRVDAIIRRKIGDVLTRDGYISEQQLQEALKLAHGSGQRLGEILIELGYLTAEDLGAAMANQEEQPVGLLDALAGESVEDCVAETGIPGLWVLPLGRATARDAGTLSPDSLHRVIEAARDRFDIVLVDTGPVPGSLEASMTASQVDALVLTVARGDKSPDVQRSLAHLRSLGTRVAGLVFNRAQKQDIARYGSSRASSLATPAEDPQMRMVDAPESARLGPVARAVASFSLKG